MSFESSDYAVQWIQGAVNPTREKLLGIFFFQQVLRKKEKKS